ncbi:unnamed protein product [Rotaria sordida]|uniref:Uncharacterized protein n=1 Tax=Rotaria sordida TaxID=392033 RepID=A0A815CMA4_9BILA|nr:unnamed protein product [Rotaria sordida]CAF1563137.1 unnamed protein product [Rotaria sordida]
MNTSQFDNARIGFGTVVNNGLVTSNNNTESTITISFRSVVWETVSIEYNNVSEGGSGPFTINTISNSSLQIPQDLPFALPVPIKYNNTYASNFVFTITNNNPSQLRLCSAYVQ